MNSRRTGFFERAPVALPDCSERRGKRAATVRVDEALSRDAEAGGDVVVRRKDGERVETRVFL